MHVWPLTLMCLSVVPIIERLLLTVSGTGHCQRYLVELCFRFWTFQMNLEPLCANLVTIHGMNC